MDSSMQNSEAQKQTNQHQSARKWRRAKVAASVLLGMVFSGFVVTPTVIMNSAYRDQALNGALNEKGLRITTESGSGSWISPLKLTGIHLTDETGALDVQIESIMTDRSLISLMMNRHNLGTIIINSPQIRLALDEEGELPESLRKNLEPDEAGAEGPGKQARPDIAFQVWDAAIELTVPWREVPIVDVDELEIVGQVQTNVEGQRWLDLNAIQVFDHESLTDLHTEQNLALVAPVLSQTTALNGEVSLKLDPIHHQLHVDDGPGIQITGHAVLHSVRATLTQDWARQLSSMMGRARGQNSASTLEVVRDSRVDFEVTEDGVYHEGLAFVLPQTLGQTQVASSGTVGFDEQVNLAFQVQLPTPQIGGAFMATLGRLLSGPLVMTVTGTISEPKLSPPPGFGLTEQLAENLRPGSTLEPAPPVQQSVMEILGTSARGSRDPGGDVTGNILDIIRAARDAKAARENAEPGAEDSPPLTPRERRRRRRGREI